MSQHDNEDVPRKGQVVAHWGPRQEPREVCAEHLSEVLIGLGEFDPLLGKWFELGKSRQAALRVEYQLDAKSIEKALKPDPQFPELGFSFSAWSGVEPSASIRAGVARDGDFVANNLHLVLPELTAESEHIYDPTVLERLMALVADALKPDWLVVESTNGPRLDFVDMQISPGWKTYVRGAKPSLKRVRKLNGASLEFVGDDAWITVDSDMWSVPETVPAELRELLVRHLKGPYPWLRTGGHRSPSPR